MPKNGYKSQFNLSFGQVSPFIAIYDVSKCHSSQITDILRFQIILGKFRFILVPFFIFQQPQNDWKLQCNGIFLVNLSPLVFILDILEVKYQPIAVFFLIPGIWQQLTLTAYFGLFQTLTTPRCLKMSENYKCNYSQLSSFIVIRMFWKLHSCQDVDFSKFRVILCKFQLILVLFSIQATQRDSKMTRNYSAI